MKKLLFSLASACLFTAAWAQVPQGTVNYYGVDFSKTKAFGAYDTGAEFKAVFGRINTLTINEWDKYNPGQFIDRPIAVKDITATALLNNQIDTMAVIAYSESTFTTEEIADMVRRYELKETTGMGLVIIGDLLNKSTGRGTFVVVCFDIATRKVLYSQSAVGKAKGFGLRNYWAGALHSALKSLK